MNLSSLDDAATEVWLSRTPMPAATRRGQREGAREHRQMNQQGVQNDYESKATTQTPRGR
jgi:hypothetical protein